VERQRPDTSSNELDLYVRTYYSLLRSTGEVRIRAFEEAHIVSRSSLHEGATDPLPDISAFGYAAARMPECLPKVSKILLGQSRDVFRGGGFEIGSWSRVSARGRRRPFRYDGEGVLAAFIASASDSDDMVPIVTAYQIEWNKMHAFLAPSPLGRGLARGDAPKEEKSSLREQLSEVLQLPVDKVDRLLEALGSDYLEVLGEIARRRCDLRIQLLAGSFSDYQRAAQRWWTALEPLYLTPEGRRRPVYFVSSNTHSLANLLGGYALAHRDEMMKTAERENPCCATGFISAPRGSAPFRSGMRRPVSTRSLTRAMLRSLRRFLSSPKSTRSALTLVCASTGSKASLKVTLSSSTSTTP
jgi:hypothetical protein